MFDPLSELLDVGGRDSRPRDPLSELLDVGGRDPLAILALQQRGASSAATDPLSALAHLMIENAGAEPTSLMLSLKAASLTAADPLDVLEKGKFARGKIPRKFAALEKGKFARGEMPLEAASLLAGRTKKSLQQWPNKTWMLSKQS